MRLRRLVLVPLVGLVGAGVAVVPPLAAGSSAPSTASFTAKDFAWQVSGSTSAVATIAQGGTVTFGYPSGSSMHNADFRGGLAPSSCTQTGGTNSGAVPPLPAQPTAPGWSGSCTFNTPGTYTFQCDLHPFMTGTIIVEGPGGTTTGTTTTGTTTTGTTTTGTTATNPNTTTQGTPTTPAGGPGRGGSPLAGTASSAIRISIRQRGTVLRGAVTVSAAGARGRLEVQLFAARTALVRGRRRGTARVGLLARGSLPAGIVRFSIPLDASARRALSLHGRLALTVRIALVSPHRAHVSVTRSVILLRAARG